MRQDPSTLPARTFVSQSSRVHWLIPAVVIGGLLAPILFSDRSFSTDWGNHLWLIWVQGENIKALGEPSYFLQSSLGVFYPYYAFYGGSFYAVSGLVSWLTSAEVAVFLAYAGALSAAYLSWTWIARQLGVVGWRSQLPGCIAVTAPLAVTNLYGRGDIPEVVATAAIPLIAAAGLSLFREERVRLSTACIYVLAVVALTGTHTLTLVWGVVFLLLVAAILIACCWRTVRQRCRRMLPLAGLTALGIGINAWILAPLFLFHTNLVERDPDPIGLTAYTDPEQLFSLFRNIGDPYPFVTADVNAQLPVLALLWVLVCGAAYWRYLPAAAKRVAFGLLGLGGALLLLILSPSLIGELPNVLQFIQFPYRIETYFNLCLVGLVTLALAAMERDRATRVIPALALAGIAAFNFVLSIEQNSRVRSWLPDRDDALASTVEPPPSWYAPLQFADGSAPLIERAGGPPLEFPVDETEDSYVAAYPPGRTVVVATNIATGDYLVEVSGARPIGRSEDGRMVVRLPAAERVREVEVSAAWGPAMTAGRWLTVVSLLVGFSAAGAHLVAGRRSRR
jgi:hypothetical protein